jgi:hypothetical protein
MDIIGIFDIDMLNEYRNQIVRLTNACAINIGLSENTIKGATQVNGHSLKQYFCMNISKITNTT